MDGMVAPAYDLQQRNISVRLNKMTNGSILLT